MRAAMWGRCAECNPRAEVIKRFTVVIFEWI